MKKLFTKKNLIKFTLLAFACICLFFPKQTAKAANFNGDTTASIGDDREYALFLREATAVSCSGTTKKAVSGSSVITQMDAISTDSNNPSVFYFNNGARSLGCDANGNYYYLNVKITAHVSKGDTGTNLSKIVCGFGGTPNTKNKEGGTVPKKGQLYVCGAENNKRAKVVLTIEFYSDGAYKNEVTNVKGTLCFDDIDTHETWGVRQSNFVRDYGLGNVVTLDKPGEKGRSHITKSETTGAGGVKWWDYNATHGCDANYNESDGQCAQTESHKVWVDFDSKSEFKVVYTASARSSELHYTAEDIRKWVYVNQYLNGSPINANGGPILSFSGTSTHSGTTNYSVNGSKKLRLANKTTLSSFGISWPGKSYTNANPATEESMDYDVIYTKSFDDPTPIDGSAITLNVYWYAKNSISYDSNVGPAHSEGTMAATIFRYGHYTQTALNQFKKYSNLTYVYMDNVTANKTERKDSTFINWKDIGNVEHSNGEYVQNTPTNTWYAQWSDPNVTLETPSRRGWSFRGWYLEPWYTTYAGASRTINGDISVYAKWIDDIKPVVSVTAEPSTWAKEANVTITALDEGSGIKTIQLYRVDSSNKETLVQTWTENPTITTQKTYTFVDTEEGSYSYKVVVSDNVGNQGVATSGKVYIDRTAPVVDESVVQGPGTYQFPVANLKNDNDEVNSECFGLYITLDASDKNGTKDVSNIKQAYVKVYNTDNPSQCYLYDLTQKAENTIERSGVDVEVPSPLNGELNTINQVAFEKRAIIDLTRDFNRVLNLSWEIHVIDVAGNDAYDVNPALKGSHQRDVEVFATIRRITYDKDLTSPTQFKSGYRGILRLTTTGWVDRINTHWAQEILQASLKDQELNQAIMIYDTTLNQDPASNPTVNISGQKLNENNTIKTIDTHNTGFTRTYDFYFWIPLYQEFKDASGNHPYLTRDGIYTITVDTERDYGYPQLNDGIKNTSVKLTIGKGSITQKFRASIVD